MENVKLVCVIVTYNRLEKLKKTLAAYETQIKPCSDLIVVNNCSTDETEMFLDNWLKSSSSFKKHVLKTASNVGGAGGFYMGTKYAVDLEADWVWLADDDAYPEKDAFEILYKVLEVNKNLKCSAFCSSVWGIDGVIDLEHRGFLKKGLYWTRENSTLEHYSKEKFEIDFLSYVGVALNAKALKQVGMCNKEFFIFFDDSEHSLRLRQYGAIVCIPTIKVIHDVPINNKNVITNKKDYGWKTYYGVRNTIYSYLNHHRPTAVIWTLRIMIWQHILFISNKVTKEGLLLMRSAVKDAWNGRLGIHNKYKPGY